MSMNLRTRKVGSPKNATQPKLPSPPRPSNSKVLLSIILSAVVIAAIYSIGALGINLMTLIQGYDNAVSFLGRTCPLTLPSWGEVFDMVGQTLGIVTLATVLGFVISLPVALCAAYNTTPHRTVRWVARLLIILERAIPTFVVAMFFVRAFGLGALPGVLALGVGSIGLMGKLYADAIEEVHPGPQQALKASGANRIQQIFGGVLPQVRPQLIATALHMFDINLRGSVLLGFVGVSGIGMWISASLETMNYGRGLGLTAVLLVLCLIAELVSMRIRRALLGSRQEDQTSPTRWKSWAVLAIKLPERGWLNRQTTPSDAPQPPSASSQLLTITPPWTPDRVKRWMWCAVGAVLLIMAFIASGLEFEPLAGGIQRGVEALSLYFPPEFGGIMDKILAAMVETVQMGLAGTLIGLIIAIPLGLASAANVVRNERINALARAIVVTIRAIPGIIIGIVFVVVTGLGPTAGALALAVGSIGFFSKVIADSFEESDSRVQEAVRSSGAGPTQVFFASTLRQVMPALTAHSMHQMDRNLREATELGVIGAGGIGSYMTNASRVLEYGVVTACVGLIIVMILTSEALSMWTRKEIR